MEPPPLTYRRFASSGGLKIFVFLGGLTFRGNSLFRGSNTIQQKELKLDNSFYFCHPLLKCFDCLVLRFMFFHLKENLSSLVGDLSEGTKAHPHLHLGCGPDASYETIIRWKNFDVIVKNYIVGHASSI